MSRSGYINHGDTWDMIRWRGAVASAIRGKRGQALLKEMADALDAMPDKRLIAEALERDGQVCALGSVGKSRRLDMSKLDPYENDQVAAAFGVSCALVQEIESINDDNWMERHGNKDEIRWRRVRLWVAENLNVKT